MFRILSLPNTAYSGIAPIITRAIPIPLALAKMGEVLKGACGWASPKDVYDPQRDSNKVEWNYHNQIANPTPEWNEWDREHLYDALTCPLETDSLIDNFSQTDGGNCALVATLKAAIRKFGNKLFYSIKATNKHRFHVRLRDGAEVRFGEEELALTREAARLRGPESSNKSFAIFSYAVAASRKVQLTPAVDLEVGLVDGWLSERERFEMALQDLAAGHHPKYCAIYLGVGNEMRVRKIDKEEALEDSTVITSFNHAVYVQRVNGEVKADHYGKATIYDGTDTNGRKSREKLTFEGDGLKDVDGWFYI